MIFLFFFFLIYISPMTSLPSASTEYMFICLKLCCWSDKESPPVILAVISHMDRSSEPATQFEVDVDLGFALFFLFLLCFFLLATVVRCAQTVVDPYGSISTSTYQEEQITWEGEKSICERTLIIPLFRRRGVKQIQSTQVGWMFYK